MLVTTVTQSAIQRPQTASSTPAPAPAPAAPSDSVDLSGLGGLPKVLVTVGEGLARLGPWGGAALGAGCGVLIQGGISGGFLMPALCAFLIGSDGAKARAGSQAMNGGLSAVQKALEQNKPCTPAPGAASAVTIAACIAELSLGFQFGLPGMALAVPAMLGTAYVMGRAAGQAESFVARQAYQT